MEFIQDPNETNVSEIKFDFKYVSNINNSTKFSAQSQIIAKIGIIKNIRLFLKKKATHDAYITV